MKNKYHNRAESLSTSNLENGSTVQLSRVITTRAYPVRGMPYLDPSKSSPSRKWNYNRT